MTTPPQSTSKPVAPGPSAPRRRNHHIADAYLDLMKPDENIADHLDATERRKIQNRLAQRAYRRNMRDRNLEVKMLREELERMREAAAKQGLVMPLSHAASPQHTNCAIMQGPGQDQPSVASSALAASTSSGPHSTIFTTPVPDHELLAACHIDAFPDTWSLTPSTETPLGVLEASLAATPLPTPPPMGFTLPTGPLTPVTAPPAKAPYPTPSTNKHQRPFSPAYAAEREYLSPPKEQGDWIAGTSMPSISPSKDPPPTGSHIPNAREPLVYHAIAGGHLETLRYLLTECHVSSNVRDSAGYTPLQRAVMAGRTDMVALLLNAGASVDEFDDASQLSEEVDGE